jgi:tRNA threonylcarbamoyladenosine modification (KEOPS) complex Cgi121 subunit
MKIDKLEVIAAESGLTKERIIETVSKMNKASPARLAQAFDADSIVGPGHIRFAFFHALKAFENKKNLMRDRALELLLRAACTRQLKDATDIVGVKDPKNIVIGFVGDKKRILRLLEAKERRFAQNKSNVIRLFGLDKTRDLEQQMIERMVLLQLD